VRVSDTSIFARIVGPETQLLVYSMKLTVAAEVAMFLPVPTPIGSPEDALSFVDMSKHASFFDDLAFMFEPPMQVRSAKSAGLTLGFAPRVKLLKVHKVGAFVASFVPSRADFHRLEPRFRLPDAVWDALPDAKDFGFAVFQLERGEQRVHPMAFRFRTRDPSRLFFPTVHVHDGTVHARAKFDHALYYQHPRLVQSKDSPFLPDIFEGAQVSFLTPPEDFGGALIAGQPLLRRELRGKLPNRDTYVSLAAA
jgi:hypothetical protein